MVAATGAGPHPILYKTLTSQKLAEAIRYCLTPDALSAAKNIAIKMKKESGVKTAVGSFHRGLRKYKLGCDVLQSQPATWVYKDGRKRVKLSRVAAQVLQKHSILDPKKLI